MEAEIRMIHNSKTNLRLNALLRTIIAVMSVSSITLSTIQVWAEDIRVTDKTGVDAICKGNGAYTGPTTLSNYSSCMFNDGSSVTCENKRDGKCTKTVPKAQVQNSTKTVPQLQLTPAPGMGAQKKYVVERC